MVKALAYVLFILGLAIAVLAGYVFWAAWTDTSARGCLWAEECATATSVMVMSACAMVAAAVMIFASAVFARR